ncbi:MAG: fused MFS/spermidine synthase [Verrucomicrobia bacterium]|nr:fused MFS/spermidine synthase [Verrucomicrobiota bacterium]
MQSRNRGGMVLALFFCSGATALVYEVVWSKFLSQMFGSTIYAQTVVLAAFMGGLALGNRLFGRWADRLAQPVATYGFLEIIIGVYAFCFPTFDRMADAAFVSLGTHIAERAGLLLVLKGVLSAALLLGPTILMGGTLPLLAAWLQKSSTDPGRRSARFYSVNSLGAVAGSALAGFWLVQSFGMVATLQITAAVNVMVGVSAVLLSRLSLSNELRQVESKTSTETDAASPGTLRWAGVIVAMTGAVSMGLEVLSSRSLALIFGSSLQSFAVVLIAFILGIGLGSAWIASPRRRGRSSEGVIVLLLCLAAAWVAVLVFNIERWVDFYRIARTGLGRTEVGYVYHQLLTTGIALVILGVPAAGIGAVLPLMIRAVSAEGAPLGAKVGALLTWNTLGAVVGTLFTGFILMPQVGLRNAFAVLALVLGLVALIVALRRRWRAGIIGSMGVCAFVGSLFIFGGEGWRYVMSSGVFRVWEMKFEPRLMPMRKEHMKILFYEDGPDATVSVEEVDGIIGPAEIGLRINGKPDAGTQVDVCNQLLLAHLPMLVRPGAKDVFVLGLASGMTAGAVLAYPVEHLDVADNCEPVIQASKLFADWNRHVLSDPRTHLWREDARTVLKLRPQLYDVIITEPSNPWTVGVGSVFSREFYELAASRLKPGGIMTQWFHVYETHDDIVNMVLRTFSSVFPFVEMWDTGVGDIVMLGALQPWPTGPEVFRQGFAIDRVATDMGMLDIRSPEALLARQLASQRTGFAIAGPGPMQSDLFPVLEYAAPRAFYIGVGSRMLDRFDERTRQQLLAPPEKRAALHSLPAVSAQLLFSTFSTVNGELFGCVFGNPSSANVPCVFQTRQPAPPPGGSGTALDQAARAFEAGALDPAAQLAALAWKQNPADPMAGYMSRVIEREKQLRQASGNARAQR